MIKSIFLVLMTLVLMLLTLGVHAERVENFVLLDQTGNAHELYYHQSASIVVLMSQSNRCLSSTNNVTAFNKLQEEFAQHNVRFFLINSTLVDDRSSVAAFVNEYSIQAPVLMDETQIIGEALQLNVAGEMLVLNPHNWSLTYRGDANPAAIRSLLNHDQTTPAPIVTATDTAQAPAACKVDFPHKNTGHAISYSKTIAPLLQDKCVLCHTEGGLGPWAMSDYNMVLGFSPMIREVLRTKRMPPWHADPHIGAWKNDISLSTKQLRGLVHWIDAGSPRGTGPDPLQQIKIASVEWPLGTPDLVLNIPAYTVPASGVVDYQFPTVANPLDTGVWIKAATVVPGDREVVHHILAGTIDTDTTQLRRDSGVFDNYLIGYAPGNESHTFPTDTGVYIPPGGEFAFQLHYTPVGRETVDRSKIGLYFHKKEPKNFYRQDVVVDPTIKIPANASRHQQVAYYQFNKPALLHDLMPHAHYRGVASRFELLQQDGTREVILNVPNYDFNWQRSYQFVSPKRIEAGTKLVHTTWYDNSTANLSNPDPQREVPWGLQSWDEMLYGAFSYTFVNETTQAPIFDKILARVTQYVGFLDKDLNGKLSWRELPKQLKKRLVQGFKAVDTNGDGGLDIQEMYEISKRQQQHNQDGEKQENVDAR
ncbi:MAG: redoxin domain-containing protein [Gammaproteobacteria bacterium]|nr:redoxin domain-containing protein [Gammaproteobacteria bacterium]